MTANHTKPLAESETRTLRGAKIVSIEDGSGRRVRVTLGGAGIKGTLSASVPGEFHKLVRYAHRADRGVDITLVVRGRAFYVVDVQARETPFSRVLELLNESGQAVHAGRYGKGSAEVHRFIIRHSGVTLLVESVRDGGVEVFAPLSRSIEMAALLDALKLELDPTTKTAYLPQPQYVPEIPAVERCATAGCDAGPGERHAPHCPQLAAE